MLKLRSCIASAIFVLAATAATLAFAQDPTTAPVAPLHVRSWSNPEDVQWFLLWFLGPGGAVVAVISLIIAFRNGKTISAVVQPQMAEAREKAARAEGKAEAVATTTQNLANTNERQQKNLDELNKASDPNKPNRVQT